LAGSRFISSASSNGILRATGDHQAEVGAAGRLVAVATTRPSSRTAMPVVPPPTSTTTPSADTEDGVRRGGLVDDRGAVEACRLDHVPVGADLADGDARRDGDRRRGELPVETLLDLGLELADEGDRSGVVEDYAVPHHVGEPGGAGDRPAAVVDGEEHGEGRAQVDPDAEAPRRLDGTGPGHGGVRRVEQLCETGVEPGHQVPPSLTSRSSR